MSVKLIWRTRTTNSYPKFGRMMLIGRGVRVALFLHLKESNYKKANFSLLRTLWWAILILPRRKNYKELTTTLIKEAFQPFKSHWWLLLLEIYSPRKEKVRSEWEILNWLMMRHLWLTLLRYRIWLIDLALWSLVHRSQKVCQRMLLLIKVHPKRILRAL